MSKFTDQQYREAVVGTGEDTDVDFGAPVSKGDDGAWVQAWVWVHDEDVEEV